MVSSSGANSGISLVFAPISRKAAVNASWRTAVSTVHGEGHTTRSRPVRLAPGDAVGAALFAFNGSVRAGRAHRTGLECGEPGETGGGEYRGVEPGEHIAQGALARRPEPSGEGIEGAAKPGQDILVTAAYPLGNSGQRVMTGAGESAHADGEQRRQPEPHPARITRIRHPGQCVEQHGRHHCPGL